MNIKKIKPMFNRVLVTMDKYEEEQMHGSIIDTTKKVGAVKEIQKVIAVGDTVRGIKEGDLVEINPDRYKVTKYDPNSVKEDFGMNKVIDYIIPTVEIDGVMHLLIYDNDIEYIIEEYEESPVIIKPAKNKIVS